jgi:hypothetical protein
MGPYVRILIKDEQGVSKCLDVEQESCRSIVAAGARKESAPDAHRRGQEMQELLIKIGILMSKFTELGELFGLKPAIGGGDHLGFVDSVMAAIRLKEQFIERLLPARSLQEIAKGKPDVGHTCAGCFGVVSDSDPALRRAGGKTWHALCLDNWINAHV